MPRVEYHRRGQARGLDEVVERKRIIRVGLGIERVVPLHLVPVGELDAFANPEPLLGRERRLVDDDRQDVGALDRIPASAPRTAAR